MLVLVDQAPLPVEVRVKSSKQLLGGKLVEGYGLTESSPFTHSKFFMGKAEFAR